MEFKLGQQLVEGESISIKIVDPELHIKIQPHLLTNLLDDARCKVPMTSTNKKQNRKNISFVLRKT